MGGSVTIKDNRLRSFMKRIKGLKNISVTVGVQGDMAQEEHPDGAMTMATLAATHEFGSEDGRHPPQRSYLRSTFDENQERYKKEMDKGGKDVAKGKITARGVMFELGEGIRKDIIKKIKAGIPPELSQRTKDAKGSSTPLIDKGHLIGSITSVVREKGKPVA